MKLFPVYKVICLYGILLDWKLKTGVKEEKITIFDWSGDLMVLWKKKPTKKSTTQKSQQGAVKSSEPETARRRRDSLEMHVCLKNDIFNLENFTCSMFYLLLFTNMVISYWLIFDKLQCNFFFIPSYYIIVLRSCLTRSINLSDSQSLLSVE